MKKILETIKRSLKRNSHADTAHKSMARGKFEEVARYTERHFGRAIVKLSDR